MPITGPQSSTPGHIAIFADETGQVLADSGMAMPVDGTIEIGIDGLGSIPETGVVADIIVPYNMTITKWTIISNISGSIVIDLWKDTYANFPPTVTDTVTGSDKPTLSSATKANSTALTGWTTTWTDGDIIRVNIDSVSTVTKIVLTISYTRTE